VCRSPCSNRCLLRIWEELPTFTKEEWSSVLSLAHKWDFVRIRALAIQKLGPITTAVDQLVLSDMFQIESWKPSAYKRICEQGNWPSLEECRRLGVDVLWKIGQARQALRASSALIPEHMREAVILSSFFPPPDTHIPGPPQLAGNRTESLPCVMLQRTTPAPNISTSPPENDASSATTSAACGLLKEDGFAPIQSCDERVITYLNVAIQDKPSASEPFALPGIIASSGAKSTDPLDAETTALRYCSSHRNQLFVLILRCFTFPQ
jgi:hypothetical protein